MTFKKEIVIPFVEGDEEALRIEWKDQDLTEFSSIKLVVRKETGGKFEIDATVIDPGPTLGITDFQFVDGQLVPGNHTAEIIVVDAVSGNVDIFPDESPFVFAVRSRV